MVKGTGEFSRMQSSVEALRASHLHPCQTETSWVGYLSPSPLNCGIISKSHTPTPIPLNWRRIIGKSANMLLVDWAVRNQYTACSLVIFFISVTLYYFILQLAELVGSFSASHLSEHLLYVVENVSTDMKLEKSPDVSPVRSSRDLRAQLYSKIGVTKPQGQFSFCLEKFFLRFVYYTFSFSCCVRMTGIALIVY